MDTAYPIYEWSGSEQTVAELLFGGLALLSLVYCVRVARRSGALWPLAVFAGALLTVFYEPINNVMAHCAWPEINQHTAFTMLGRDMPWAAVGVYTVYFAAPVVWMVQRFDAGVTRARVGRFWLGALVFAALFEPVFASEDVGVLWWRYYGDQAFMPTGLPLWWWFANSMVLVATASFVHLLRRHVLHGRDGARTWLIVPGLPLTLFAAHISAGLPVYMAVGGDAGMTWIWIATLMTAAICVGYVWVMAQLVGRPDAEPDHASHSARDDTTPWSRRARSAFRSPRSGPPARAADPSRSR